MASVGKKKAVAPKLRFPEYAGQALRETRLSEVTVESSIRNGGGLPAGTVMGVSKVLGIVPMEERIIASDIARYKLVKKDWFAYNPMRLNIGSIARSHGDADVLVSPDYVVFQCRNDQDFGIESNYLDHFRQSEAWANFVNEGGDGGVRIRIYYKDIARLELALPKREEQQKIANCLTSLDELIVAQERKVESLKTHKRGLMQQLFPREGETLPCLRFAEFRDSPSDFVLIGRFAKVKTGAKDTQNKVDGGAYPFFVRSQNVERIDSFSHEGEAVLTSGDGVGVGENYHYINGQFDFHQRVYCIYDFAHGTSGKFFFHYFSTHFKKRVKQMSAKNSVDSVRMAMITEMPVWMPLLAEQQRIAECLTTLDTKIVAESEKIEALKNHKKGLMQQLLPTSQEA